MKSTVNSVLVQTFLMSALIAQPPSLPSRPQPDISKINVGIGEGARNGQLRRFYIMRRNAQDQRGGDIFVKK